MLAGIASLARNVPKIAKIFSKGKPKNIRVYRSEPLPSSGGPNFKYLPGDKRAQATPHGFFGQHFTPDKEFVKRFSLSPDESKGIKSVVIPVKDFKKYQVKSKLRGNIPELILPPELAKKAKYNFFDSLRYLFDTPYIFQEERALHHLYPGRSTSWVKKKIKLEKKKHKLALKRFFELLKLKSQGKKSGGIVSLVL